MWVFSSIGFFSAVQKPWDRATDHLTVRARCRKDLQELRKRVPSATRIIESKSADYAFRMRVKREAFADLMAQLSREIEYDNFKDHVKAKQGYDRARLYGRVWGVMLELQEPVRPRRVGALSGLLGEPPLK